MKSFDARLLRRRAVAFGTAVCVALAVNDMLPYVGMRDDSCQTMFSDLEWSAEENNHLFVPQHALSDLWRYWYDVRVEIDPPAPGTGRVAELAAWLDQPDHRYNDEALRVAVRQMCARGHIVRLSRRRHRDAPLETFDDACAGDSFRPRWWLPVRLYEIDVPNAAEPTRFELLLREEEIEATGATP